MYFLWCWSSKSGFLSCCSSRLIGPTSGLWQDVLDCRILLLICVISCVTHSWTTSLLYPYHNWFREDCTTPVQRELSCAEENEFSQPFVWPVQFCRAALSTCTSSEFLCCCVVQVLLQTEAVYIYNAQYCQSYENNHVTNTQNGKAPQITPTPFCSFGGKYVNKEQSHVFSCFSHANEGRELLNGKYPSFLLAESCFLHVCLSKQEYLNFPSGSLRTLLRREVSF